MNNFLSEIFERDLLKLKEELTNFKDEANIWKTTDGVSNSAGNLALHLMGNLHHFIGAMLGNTGYVRKRDEEFSQKNISREEMLANIDKVIAMVPRVLNSLTTAQLQQDFPFEVFGKRQTEFYLMHFYGHLSYHLGQINYLRRILEA